MVFASRYGFSAGAVRDWEQGRQPERAARILLTIIDREPEFVNRVVAPKVIGRFAPKASKVKQSLSK